MKVVRLHNKGALVLIGLFIFTSTLYRGSAESVKLAWDPPVGNVDGSDLNDLVGYNLYHGTNSGIYSSFLEFDAATTTGTVTGLTAGVTYYFTVTALNSLGLESGPSAEVVWQAPDITVDTTPPSITAPATITITASGSGQTALPDLRLSASVDDDVTPPSEITLGQVPAPGTLVDCGAASVTLTATDLAGNTAQTVVTVMVADQLAPAINGLENMSLQADADGFASVPDLSLSATVQDNCSPTPEITLAQSPAAGTQWGPVGSTAVDYTVIFSATDLSGNRSEVTLTVSVVPDTTPPLLTAPETVEITASESGQTPLPDFESTITVSDDLSGNLEILVTQTPAPGTLVGCGATFVSIQAADRAGNTAQANITVMIRDKAGPTITGVGAMILRADESGYASLPDFSTNAVLQDNCSAAPQITFSQSPPPATALAGPVTNNLVEYPVVLSGWDESGNLTEETIIVSVRPANSPPEVYAGDDLNINSSDGLLALSGAVSDDGYPAGGVLTTLWREVSGPAAVDFDDPTRVNSNVMFLEEGVYVLELSANDGALTASDEVIVTVRLRGKPKTPKGLRIK